jgi:hypothetical protein
MLPMALRINLKRKGVAVAKKLKEGSAAEERSESRSEAIREGDVGPGGQDKAFPGQGAMKNPHTDGSQSKHPKKRPN